MPFELNEERIKKIRAHPAYMPSDAWVQNMLCNDWEAMHEVVTELAKRECESPDTDFVLYRKDCGKCLSCRAKKLVEEKEEKDGNNPVHS